MNLVTEPEKVNENLSLFQLNVPKSKTRENCNLLNLCNYPNAWK